MGGGVMRTAAKAALGGYRPAAPFTARASSTAARRSASSAPPPSTAAVVEGAPVSIQIGEQKGVSGAPPALSQWEMDDWEFAGWKDEDDELIMGREAVPAPRLVFGPVPTLEEAKEATTDLKDALERVYFSDSAVEVSGKQENEGQNRLFQESRAVITSMPRHVSQAFHLLQASPEAQSVVASLVTDKIVWDAVMKNEQVMEFYKKHQSSFTENECDRDDSGNKNPTEGADGEHTGEKPNSSGFSDFMNNVKMKAQEVVDNISHFIQDLFGLGIKSETDGNNSSSFITPQNTFLALAVATILIIVFKRA